MKFTRGAYPGFFALLLLGPIYSTVKSFSNQVAKDLLLPIIVTAILLVLITILLSLKDKDFFYIQTDERTKKADRAAGYYSWWLTIISVPIIGSFGIFYNFSAYQSLFLIITIMLLSMVILHMYFNLLCKI